MGKLDKFRQAQRRNRDERRMAGERLSSDEEFGLSQLLANIEGEADTYVDRAVDDGKQVVALNDANRDAFINAGVPAARYNDEIGLIRDGDNSNVPGYGRFLDTGHQDTLVPAPYESGTGKRVFAQYAKNPVTGVPQIVPVLDPNDASQALSVDYGSRAPQGVRASELVQEKLLTLMGASPSQYAGVNGVHHGAADFQATLDGRRQNIDGMVRNNSEQYRESVNIPVYMNIRPEGYYRADESRTLNSDVKRLITEQLRKGQDIESAVNTLGRSGKLQGPREEERIGKVLRSDASKVAEGKHYDGLIVTGYDSTDNVLGKGDKGGLIAAPSTAHLVDLELARQKLNQVTGMEARNRLMVSSNPHKPAFLANQANNSKVQNIYQLSDQVNGQSVFKDVLADPRYALAHQMMRDLQYR